MARDNAYWRSDALGEPKELELPQGRMRYHDRGSGPAVVFVHGALVNANLWRKVVAELAPDCRCVALDLPLGADLIADAIAALGLEDVTLVGNDTGGAMCQLVAMRRPEGIGRLVLTSCDALDNFPPKAMQPMMPVLRVPGALSAMLAPTRMRAVRKRIMTMIGLAKRPIEQEAVDSYALPP